MRFRLALLLSLLALVVAACGGSESGAGGSGPDPATAVPADAPMYFEVVARPDGDLKSGVEDALKKLLRTDDPGRKVVELFDKAAAEGDVSWEELEAWLGGRAGVFLNGFDGERPTGALVAETTDADKAQATLDKLARTDEDIATAVVGDWAVLGTDAGVEAVRTATEDAGKTLAEEPDFKAAREAVAADEALGHFYVEPQGLLDIFEKLGDTAEGSPFESEQALGVFRQLFAKAGRAAAVSFQAEGDALRMSGATLGAPEGANPTAAADALAGLPGDAWLGVGFGDLGTTLTDALAQFRQIAGVAGESQLDVDELFRSFERKLGIDLRADFLSWMGDGAVYARGRSLADIGGLVTIETKDAERSRKAVGILARALQGAGATVEESTVPGYDVAVEVRNAQVPASLVIAANDERFSVGVNPQALADVADPEETLGDADTFGTAQEALGEGVTPVAIIDTPTIISLLETFGVGDAEGYDKVKPYLDALGPLSAGMGRDGDVSRFGFALGLR